MLRKVNQRGIKQLQKQMQKCSTSLESKDFNNQPLHLKQAQLQEQLQKQQIGEHLVVDLTSEQQEHLLDREYKDYKLLLQEEHNIHNIYFQPWVEDQKLVLVSQPEHINLVNHVHSGYLLLLGGIGVLGYQLCTAHLSYLALGGLLAANWLLMEHNVYTGAIAKEQENLVRQMYVTRDNKVVLDMCRGQQLTGEATHFIKNIHQNSQLGQEWMLGDKLVLLPHHATINAIAFQQIQQGKLDVHTI